MSHVVHLTVTNFSTERCNLVLEPLGEIYCMEPGQTRSLTYNDDPDPRLAIHFGAGEIKIWEEGSGTLEFDR